MLPLKAPLSKKLEVKATSLIRIMLDHIISDELHLMLRIFDVLIHNNVVHAIDWDKKQNICQPSTPSSVERLQQYINEHCRVTFHIWDQDKKGPDFTLCEEMIV
jgi:hypothetical protein